MQTDESTNLKKDPGGFTSDGDSANAELSDVVQYFNQLQDEDVVKAREEEEYGLQERHQAVRRRAVRHQGRPRLNPHPRFRRKSPTRTTKRLQRSRRSPPRWPTSVQEGFDVMHSTRSLVLHLIAKCQVEKLKCNKAVSANYKYDGKTFMLVCTTCDRNVQLLVSVVPSPTVRVGTEMRRE